MRGVWIPDYRFEVACLPNMLKISATHQLSSTLKESDYFCSYRAVDRGIESWNLSFAFLQWFLGSGCSKGDEPCSVWLTGAIQELQQEALEVSCSKILLFLLHDYYAERKKGKELREKARKIYCDGFDAGYEVSSCKVLDCGDKSLQ